jgi:hypothetical protein
MRNLTNIIFSALYLMSFAAIGCGEPFETGKVFGDSASSGNNTGGDSSEGGTGGSGGNDVGGSGSDGGASSSSTGGNGCVPSVTCESAGFVCGGVDNGCGTRLECGDCPSNPSTTWNSYINCGGVEPSSDPDVVLTGVDGQCGGGCVLVEEDNGDDMVCATTEIAQGRVLRCSMTTGAVMQEGWEGCKSLTETIPSDVWCCPN